MKRLKRIASKKPLTQEQILTEIRARVASSNQRQVALAAALTPQQLNQVLRGQKAISSLMAFKLGYETRYVRRAGVGV